MHEVELRKTRKILNRKYLPITKIEDKQEPVGKTLARIDRMMALAFGETRKIA